MGESLGIKKRGDMGYFYGPVPSRRLGFSLGVDLMSEKTCSFSCIYCQLGFSKKRTTRRFECVNLNSFKHEFKEILKHKKHIDYVTISGSGEPTLHKNLDKIISAIKTISHNKYQVCVITNSSLLYRRQVRQELKQADLIIPSLDSAVPATFRKINRPCKSIQFEKVLTGLTALRKEFKGKIWLEVMLLKGINDSLREAQAMQKAVNLIKPDRIHLNLPVRPPAKKVLSPSKKNIERFRKVVGDTASVPFNRGKNIELKRFDPNLAEQILSYIARRPATVKDLASVFGCGVKKIENFLLLLLHNCRIREIIRGKKKHYILNDKRKR
ncbi:MAG: radical SAM protein [Candidatus Omnitrophica bacterium]|nr:radical SAM protein [Candidatus Omnitrophota bacterium]MDD5430121.1 radical SAM protein [Candidatus Omnitrophota bacterium]